MALLFSFSNPKSGTGNFYSMPEFKLQKKIILFSDFDGTIALGDVGNRLFHHFSDGRSDLPVERWRSDLIDSQQCLIEEAQTLRDVTEKELFEFIDQFKLDPGFAGFVEMADSYQIPLFLLSDGLDLYINRLLTQNGFHDLTVFANHAKLVEGRLKFDWPYFEKSCGRCANCKGYHLRSLCGEDCMSIYIGDGKSDLCALGEADLIFACDYLAEYCLQNKIEFLPFDDFSAITDTVRDIVSGRKSIPGGDKR